MPETVPVPETVSSKHTPGPWGVDRGKESKGVIFIFAGSTDLAVLYRQDVAIMLGRKSASEDIVADARLMAAAPDLLAAIEQYFAICADSDFSDYLAQSNAADDALRAAVAKAKGETHA